MRPTPILSRLFGGMSNNNANYPNSYTSRKYSSKISPFNHTQKGVLLGRGMLNIAFTLALGSVGVAISHFGIYIEVLKGIKTYRIFIDKEKKKVSASVQGASGKIKALSKEDRKYVLPILLPIRFVDENPSYKPLLKALMEEIKEKEAIVESDNFELFFDALYYWGKTDAICQSHYNRLSILRKFPDELTSINSELGLKPYAFKHVVFGVSEIENIPLNPNAKITLTVSEILELVAFGVTQAQEAVTVRIAEILKKENKNEGTES